MLYILYTEIKEAIHEECMEKFLPTFSTQFQQKIKKYKRWEDAQSSLLGRVLLNKALKEIGTDTNYNLKYNAFNKPYLKNGNINFNISHSGEIVICAVTKLCDIGVDIEKMSPIDISGFKFMMTENEWNKINNTHNKELSFYTYWTQKEAAIKAHGKGLSIPLTSFEIYKEETIIDSKKFYLQNINIHDDYSCHVALKEKKMKTVNIVVKKITLP